MRTSGERRRQQPPVNTEPIKICWHKIKTPLHLRKLRKLKTTCTNIIVMTSSPNAQRPEGHERQRLHGKHRTMHSQETARTATRRKRRQQRS